MSRLGKQFISLLLTLVMAASFAAGGLTTAYAAEAPPLESADQAGEATPEESAPGDEPEQGGESAPKDTPEEESEEAPNPPESVPESEPEAAEEVAEEAAEAPAESTGADLEAILAAAETDGALAARMINAIADEDAWLAALRAVLDLYYAGYSTHRQYAAFAAALDGRAAPILKNYQDAAEERQREAEELGYLPGQVIIAYEGGVSLPEAEALTEEKNATPEAEVAIDIDETLLVAEISLENTVEQAVAEFEADPQVVYAEPVYLMTTAEDAAAAAEPAPDFYTAYALTQAETALPAEVSIPNDPEGNTAAKLDTEMWYMEAVHTLDAWSVLESLNVPAGTGKVRVAVIDTTQDKNHEDLQENVLWNLFRDFRTGEGRTGRPWVEGVTYPATSGHGTHVTGTIAATANNSLGVFGVASGPYNDYVEVIPINAFEVTGTSVSNGQILHGGAAMDAIANAIYYAVENGAQVINMSLTYKAAASGSGFAPVSATLKAAVDAAEAAGVVVVGAAGNGTSSVPANADPYYPSDMPNVIGVINVRDRESYPNGTRYPGGPEKGPNSNWGASKDISAPGTYIKSTVNLGSYDTKDGTSMASPIVSAAAALVLYAHPGLSPADVYDVLTGTALDLGEQGFDIYTGWGMVDLGAAVTSVSGPVPQNVTATSATASDIDLAWSAVEGAESYLVLRASGTADNHGAFQQVKAISAADWAGEDTILYRDSGDGAGETFCYRISAVADGAASWPSPIVSAKRVFPAPAGLARTGSTTTSVSLAWDAVPGAEGYFVYRADSAGGEYAKLLNGGLVGNAATAFTDTTAAAGADCHYKVTAYVERDGVFYESLATEALRAPARLAAPTGAAAAPADFAAVALTWDTVAQADGYYVYRSTEGAGFEPAEDNLMTTLGQVTAWTDDTTKTGQAYHYKVVAMRTVNGAPETGDASTAVGITAAWDGPANLTAVPVSGTAIDLGWDAVPGADGYNLYRSTTGSFTEGGAQLVQRLEGSASTAWGDTGLNVHLNYYYAVGAFAHRSGTEAESAPSQLGRCVRTQLTAPANLRVRESGKGRVTLAWGAVTGATGYAVYYSTATDLDGNAQPVAEVAAPPYSHTVDSSDGTGYYWVKAVRQPDNGLPGDRYPAETAKDYGPASGTLSAAPTCEAPASLTAQSAGYNGIRLSWPAAAGADGYYIYRAASAAGPYALAGVNKGAGQVAFLDKGLSFNVRYHYRVYSYIGEGGQVMSFSYAAADALTALDETGAFTAEAEGLHAVRLRWDPVAGAKGYYVYRAADAAGPFTKVYKSVGSKTFTLLDTPVAAGTWHYAVAAWRTSGRTKVIGPLATDSECVMTLAAVENVAATSTADYTAALTWDKADGAKGYYVYRSVACPIDPDFDDSFVLVKTVTGGDKPGVALTGQPAGAVSYRVAAYATVKSKKMAGAPSLATQTDIGGLRAVTGLAATGMLYGVSLEWDALEDEGVSGYRIYRSALAPGADGFAGSFKLVKTVTSRSTLKWANTPLAAGGYTYRVVPYQKKSGKVYEGAHSQAQAEALALDPVALDPADTSAPYTATLTWGAVEDAAGYYVYRTALAPEAEGYEKSLKRVKTLSKGSYEEWTDTPLAAGNYTYRVVAYAKKGGKTMLGAPATIPVTVFADDGPSSVTASPAGMNTVRLDWSWSGDAPKTCNGYYIYRTPLAETDPGFEDSFKLVKTVTSRGTLKWTDTTVPAGDYAYRVAARYRIGGKNLASLSAGSLSVSVEALAAPAGLGAVPGSGYYTAALEWGRVDGAKGYYLYRSDRSDLAPGDAGFDDSFVLVKTLSGVSKTKHTDTGLAGGGYWYKVAAWRTAGGRKVAGAASGAKYFSPSGLPAVAMLGTGDEPVPFAAAAEGLYTVRVNWQPVAGASGYCVYRYSGPASGADFGEYQLAATVTRGKTGTVKLTRLPAGTHYFMIAPYYTAGKQKIVGPTTGPAAADVAPLALDNAPNAVATGASQIKVSWDRVPGATGYYVYCNGARVATVKQSTRATLSYTQKKLAAGTPYTYEVAPYYKSGSVLFEEEKVADRNAPVTLP